MKNVAVRARPHNRGGRARSDGRESTVPSQAIIQAHLREHIDPETRRAMVAEAAYFYAEHRGFEPGYELDDWLAAEDQIAAALTLEDLKTAALATIEGRG